MTLFVLELKEFTSHELGWRANLGIELSRWCQEQGLVREQDYAWAFIPDREEIHFKFFGEDPAFASMFALRWAEYL